MLRLVALLFIPLLAAPVSLAETLRQVLLAQKVPLSSFQESELQQNVAILVAGEKQTVFLAYQSRNGDMLVGPTHLVSYDRASNTILRRDLDKTDICSGSTDEVFFIGEFILLSTSISPSGECLLAFDQTLNLRQKFYGFEPVIVAPGQIIITENMVHFSPVHPERLQLADLRTGATTELYPPKDDALRAQLAREHAKHLPSKEICMRMNDPCDPETFDEAIFTIGTDGKGRFALVADQSANQAMEEGKEPETVVSQRILYIYSHTSEGWRYCQKKVDGPETKLQKSAMNADFDAVCSPNLPVVPDMSTAVYNPFMKH